MRDLALTTKRVRCATVTGNDRFASYSNNVEYESECSSGVQGKATHNYKRRTSDNLDECKKQIDPVRLLTRRCYYNKKTALLFIVFLFVLAVALFGVYSGGLSLVFVLCQGPAGRLDLSAGVAPSPPPLASSKLGRQLDPKPARVALKCPGSRLQAVPYDKTFPFDSRQTRLAFLRIQKVASTTVFDQCNDQCDKHGDSDAAAGKKKASCRRWCKAMFGYHYDTTIFDTALGLLENNNGLPFHVMAMLRDPVARVVSEYYYSISDDNRNLRQDQWDYFGGAQELGHAMMHHNAKKRPTLAEFVRHPFNPANNRMTRYIGGYGSTKRPYHPVPHDHKNKKGKCCFNNGIELMAKALGLESDLLKKALPSFLSTDAPTNWPQRTTGADLAKAMRVLDCTSVLGLTDEMEKTAELFEFQVGWQNVSFSDSRKGAYHRFSSIDADLLDEIRVKNYHDVRLYEHAQELFKSRYAQLKALAEVAPTTRLRTALRSPVY